LGIIYVMQIPYRFQSELPKTARTSLGQRRREGRRKNCNTCFSRPLKHMTQAVLKIGGEPIAPSGAAEMLAGLRA